MVPNKGQVHKRALAVRAYDNYDKDVAEYTWLADSYEGTGGYAPFIYPAEAYSGAFNTDYAQTVTYLRRYPREHQDKWTLRIRNQHYVGFIKWIVNIWVGLLTRETPARSGYPDKIVKWLDEVTPTGNSLDAEIASTILPWWLVLGHQYAVVARMPDVADPASAAQATTLPTVQIIHPANVLRAPTDQQGKLLYCVYKGPLPQPEDPFTLPDDGYRLWYMTREGWWYYDVLKNQQSDLTVVESGEWDAPLRGRVPIATLSCTGQAPIYPMAVTALRLFNVLSMLGEIHDTATFPVLAWPCKSPDDIALLNWGTSTAVPYPHDGSPPQYVQLDVAPGEQLADRAKALVEEMKALSSLQQNGAGGNSGIAKAYEFLMTDRTIVSYVSALEKFDLQVCDLAARWMGMDGIPSAADAGYPRSFDVQEIGENLAAAQKLLDLHVTPTMARIAKRSAFTKVYSNLSADQMVKIDEELNAQSTPEIVDMKVEATGPQLVEVEPR